MSGYQFHMIQPNKTRCCVSGTSMLLPILGPTLMLGPPSYISPTFSVRVTISHKAPRSLHAKRLLLAILQTGSHTHRHQNTGPQAEHLPIFLHLTASVRSPGRKAERGQPWVEERSSKPGIQTLPLPCCVAWDNFISFSGPQSPHPKMRSLNEISSSHSSLCSSHLGRFYEMQTPQAPPMIHF